MKEGEPRIAVTESAGHLDALLYTSPRTILVCRLATTTLCPSGWIIASVRPIEVAGMPAMERS
jgi:hypothetical protein